MWRHFHGLVATPPPVAAPYASRKEMFQLNIREILLHKHIHTHNTYIHTHTYARARTHTHTAAFLGALAGDHNGGL